MLFTIPIFFQLVSFKISAEYGFNAA